MKGQRSPSISPFGMPIIESLVLESLNSSPKSHGTQGTHGTHETHGTLFEDAHSEGLDDLAREMAAIVHVEETSPAATGVAPLSNPPTASTPLSVSEMESSRRIRKKYGLDDDYAPSVLSSADGNEGGSFSNHPPTQGRSSHAQEIAIIQATMQLLVQHLSNGLVDVGSVDETHPLLAPFLALIEIALHHGWRGIETGVFSRPFRLWDLLKRTERHSRARDTKLNIENVRNFSSLTRSSARVRAWIRLALMNKRLAADLTLLITNEGSLFAYVLFPPRRF